LVPQVKTSAVHSSAAWWGRKVGIPGKGKVLLRETSSQRDGEKKKLTKAHHMRMVGQKKYFWVGSSLPEALVNPSEKKKMRRSYRGSRGKEVYRVGKEKSQGLSTP